MEPTAGLDQAATTHLVNRYFTTAGQDPYDSVKWKVVDAKAGDFEMEGVEAPENWSLEGISIVAKLYFATVDGVKETSVRQMIDRVISKITLEGIMQGHFGVMSSEEWNEVRHHNLPFDRKAFTNDDAAAVFYDELAYINLHQLATFNTPTWVNLGVPTQPQCAHACYPLSVKDTMVEPGGPEGQGITNWWAKEALIFKSAGGSGINVSTIRGSMEPLSSGGVASGPLAYMRASNAGAETLKSGGKHRRAAKFVCLDADHPDILDFIDCKVREDEHMKILAAGGVDMRPFTPEGERNIAETTSFQSANHSVCVTDEFMHAATRPQDVVLWPLKARVTGQTVAVVEATRMLDMIAQAAWKVADPGMIFIDMINAMHTTPSLGSVTTTNTCGEVTQNDDTACNLSALNVLKFVELERNLGDGRGGFGFRIQDFQHVVDVMATSMDIVCGFSELPTELITQNTRDLRQLGMGFTNLGAAIMAQGMPYDSDGARGFAASITALLTGRVYRHSAVMAEKLGAFARYDENTDAMMSVLRRHQDALPSVVEAGSVWSEAADDWAYAVAFGELYGYRNALATAMMPTGTVSFFLGASPDGSTGVEPVIAPKVVKRLAGAGTMEMISKAMELGANALGGYSDDNLAAFADGDWSACSSEDKATFATALGSNSISPMGHVRMVAAIQPFVSQAISKTINVPNEATVEDIKEVYVEAWRMGVKVISVYRDGSKSTQVLKAVEKAVEEPEKVESVKTEFKDGSIIESFPNAKPGYPTEIHQDEVNLISDGEAPGWKWHSTPRSSLDDQIAEQVAPRMRMPRTRQALVHKIHVRGQISEHEGYIHAGMYPDGRLGEIFIEGFGKSGGFTQNALSAWATAFSIGLQYGVPMEVLCRKHAYTADETGGIVVPAKDEQLVLRSCKSIIDYIARWLVAEFGDVDQQEELGVMTDAVKARKAGQQDMVMGMDFGVSGEPAFFFLKTESDVSPQAVFHSTPEPHFVVSHSNGHKRSVDLGPPCVQCGSTMYRAGACWQCACGANTGCS